MPAFETMDLFQKAVLWVRTGVDKFGQATTAAPVQINCRWVGRKGQTLDPKGNVIALDAQIVVASSVVVGSLMWLGTLAAWNAGEGANPNDEVMEVVTSDTTTSLNNRFTRRNLGVKRYKDTLPPRT